MKSVLICFLVCLVFLNRGALLAQEIDGFEDVYVSGEFKTTALINTQTTQTIKPKSFELNVQHRFGNANLKQDFMKNFMGLDLASIIRLGFSFPINKDMSIGIGRTNYDKVVDIEAKYNILKQREDNRIPLFLTVYASAYAKTYDLPDMSIYDSTFRYSNADRFSYFSQVIISRKFSNKFSMLFAPSYMHRNLVENHENNNTFIFPLGCKIKTTFQTSVIIEYAHVLNKPQGNDDVYAIGYEIATAGHAFQIILSNNRHVSAPYLYSTPSVNPLDGQFFIGFNIHRTFFIKK